MKKLLLLALVVMSIAFCITADDLNHSNSVQGIMLEIGQYNERSSRPRAPMRKNLEAIYYAETNIIDITYEEEEEGEVNLYLGDDLIEHSPIINTSIQLPAVSGIYTIEIIGENWSAYGHIKI